MTNPIKIMFDSNAFDYIHNENLMSDLLNSVKKGKLECICTDIQKQEIASSNRAHLQNLMQSIPFVEVSTSGAIVGPDAHTKRGFGGSRIGSAKVFKDHDADLFKQYSLLETNTPDSLMVLTAISNGIDCLVTNDTIFPRLLEIFKKTKNTNLRIIKNDQLKKLL